MYVPTNPPPVVHLPFDQIRSDDLVSRATQLATLHSTAMLGPSHPDKSVIVDVSGKSWLSDSRAGYVTRVHAAAQ